MTPSSIPITIELPTPIAEQLAEEASRQKMSVRELVRELILEDWSGLPSLPDDVEAELAAFHSLSDNVLWLIARTTLSSGEREELADLNDEAHFVDSRWPSNNWIDLDRPRYDRSAPNE